MELVVRKMGNSLGLTFPTAISRDLDIKVGQSFEMKKGVGGTLVLRLKPELLHRAGFEIVADNTGSSD